MWTLAEEDVDGAARVEGPRRLAPAKAAPTLQDILHAFWYVSVASVNVATVASLVAWHLPDRSLKLPSGQQYVLRVRKKVKTLAISERNGYLPALPPLKLRDNSEILSSLPFLDIPISTAPTLCSPSTLSFNEANLEVFVQNTLA